MPPPSLTAPGASQAGHVVVFGGASHSDMSGASPRRAVVVLVLVVVLMLHGDSTYDAPRGSRWAHDPRRAQRSRAPRLAGAAAEARADRVRGRGGLRRRVLRACRPSPRCPTCRPRRRTSVPLDSSVPFERAAKQVGEQLATLESLDVAIARVVDDIVPGRVNAIVHFEGAEPIAPDLSDLEEWYGRGLRSLGIVWSRPNAFGEGVPFRFPASPDTGAGLTEAGRDLVHACNFLGIMVDVSHLNETGFWDVVAATDAPVVATHSNPHALCPVTRNLTDRAARRDRRVGRHRRDQLRRRVPARGRPERPGHAGRGDRPARRLRRLPDRGRARRVRVGLRRGRDPGRARLDPRAAAPRRGAARCRLRRRRAGADHAPQLAARPRRQLEPAVAQALMRTREPAPGLTVSVVGLGCNNFGWRLDAARTRRSSTRRSPPGSRSSTPPRATAAATARASSGGRSAGAATRS